MLSVDVKADIMKKFQKSANDTGSTAVQVALLTENIKSLTGHLKTHRKDLHSMRGLVNMVSKRRKLLKYLKNTNSSGYSDLIKELGIRK